MNEETSLVVTDHIELRYDYALGEVAGTFMEGLKQGKILASYCSKSGLTYLPPRSYCERSFQPCDGWTEAGLEGTIEAATIVVRGFEGKRKTPVAIAFVRLDGVDSAIANFVDGLDLSDCDVAMKALAPGKRVAVVFAEHRQGRITDFSFKCIGQDS
ncbi:putative nucleic-acid-binding protein containing a Zn-ribbon [Variovorax sp. SRS16]|uniref:Zn-ribbon domain-containing OB-fold protein n=1 Tax=Variovorax sp. SRS16 TaxID=282217 RepID=UPI001318FDE5|nr:OB-fold domain-containing protein [Variovorax sp. SRS16]VTU32397.1 putative nucleic-acid-binding protein containing a Zn-ribbon [Variovorax sp. SRS16]